MDWVALFALPAIVVGAACVLGLHNLAALALDSAGAYKVVSAIGTVLIVLGVIALVAVDLWRAVGLFWWGRNGHMHFDRRFFDVCHGVFYARNVSCSTGWPARALYTGDHDSVPEGSKLLGLRTPGQDPLHDAGNGDFRAGKDAVGNPRSAIRRQSRYWLFACP